MKIKSLFATFLVAAGFAAAQTVNPGPLFPSTNRSPQVVNVYSATNQSASITTTNLQCPQTAANSPSGASSAVAGTVNAIQSVPPATVSTSGSAQICPAGVYRVTAFLQNTSGTNGGGTATTTMTYKTSATTQSITSSLVAALTESTGNVVQGSYVLVSDGSANITIAVAQSSTGNFDCFFTLERLQ